MDADGENWLGNRWTEVTKPSAEELALVTRRMEQVGVVLSLCLAAVAAVVCILPPVA